MERTLAETLTYLGQCVAFTETTQKLPRCNTCGKLKTCKYRPEWGEPTRINCPLWVKEGERMDLIDRQAAIDALRMDISIIPFAKAREYVRATIETIYNRLEELPSAQPEIIRCRDCKHYYFADNRVTTEQCWVCGLINKDIVDADDFCSRAERRQDE